MTDFTTAAQAAKQALDAKLAERCVRCGAIRRQGREFCRDEHDHRFLPADHWLVKKAERVIAEVEEYIFKKPAAPASEVPHQRCSACRERFDGASCPNCGAV